jgi:hypothetical protein
LVDIFDEVDEELRAEQAEKVLKRYGGVIVAGAVLVVGLVAGWQGWQWWQAKQDAAAATAYVNAATAVENAAPTDAAARTSAINSLDALTAGAPAGYRTLARLREAALKADAGDMAGAVALWDKVAGDGAADPLIRDLATLMWAERQLDQGDPDRLAARLKPLTAPGNAWRSLALEQLALLDMRQGHTDAARDTFKKLSQDVTAPSGVRSRASALLSRLGA